MFIEILYIKKLFDNPIVSLQVTITDCPNKERRHLGVASNSYYYSISY